MSLDRLALNRIARSVKPEAGRSKEPSPAKSPAEWNEPAGRRGALAFVRHGAASWRGFRVLERGLLEGAWGLTREGHGQTLLVALHGPRAFVDQRVEAIEVKAIDPNRPYGLMRDVLRAVLAHPQARSAAAALPAELAPALKTPSETPEVDRGVWAAAVTGCFAKLSTPKPLLIVLEHIHRADANSLELLDTLARAVSSSRILLIITYRIDAPSDPQLDHMMRSLRDARLARSMVVAAPHADEARLLFQSAFGRSVRLETAATSIVNDEAALLTHGLTLVEMCRRAGRWSEAKTAAERVSVVGEAHHIPFVACSAEIAIGHLLADQGKWDESLERLERIQSVVESIKEDALIAWLYWGLARARWGTADRRRAFQMLRLAQAVAGRSADAALGAAIALCGVEWLADNRRARVSREWLDSIGQMVERPGGAFPEAAHATAQGAVALADGDAIAASGYFRAALRKWSELGNAYSVARAHLRLASALLARDDADGRREGREELGDAHATFTRLGAAGDVAAAEELGARHGVRPRARRSVASGSASPGGITPREREVLELLVRGLTNRQIAATLSITEKTAEGHVSNILAKLGVTSRGQAAGYAVANGLLEMIEA